MQELCNGLWREIAHGIRQHLSADAFHRWFAAIELVGADEFALTLQVPNSIYQFWIESNYLNVVESVATSVLGSHREIKFSGADSAMTGAAVSSPDKVSETPTPRSQDEDSADALNHGMNPCNRFETFVVGSNNRTYNPLFIYGGVGLGKTHLMQAIGQHAIERKKTQKVMYLSSERFANEFIDAIQRNKLVGFRKRYRQTDVLLIDDIQFLAGKEHSQEEFFHTFNTLFDGSKQIVLSSDRPASEISKLEHRLVSRLECGLTTELHPPDIETRMAILKTFGGWHHGTVLHACKVVSMRMKNEEQLRQTMEGLATRLDRERPPTNEPGSLSWPYQQ